ncbi:hypothetical protein ABZ490_23655 [Streptomyces sp. NPDC005811]|uniref:hypothetical protein n=1 Tax=Streptomyces sp. NPDC005811 TaxID=3154565 RepID=UPI0034053409
MNLVEGLRPAGVIELGGLSTEDIAHIERNCCPVISQEPPADVSVWIGLLQAEHLHSRGFTDIAYAFLSDARGEPYGKAQATTSSGPKARCRMP